MVFEKACDLVGQISHVAHLYISKPAESNLLIMLQPLETLTPLLIQPGFTGKQPFHQEALGKVGAC